MKHITVLTPVYNDWDSLSFLLQHLDGELRRAGLTAQVVAVDDGSYTAPAAPPAAPPYEAIADVRIVHLCRNVGHQRALAIGLCYVHDNLASSPVVMMDADGEDDPRCIVRLLQAAQCAESPQIIFGSRSHRSEGVVFSAFYALYRLLFRLLTGRPIRFGNFCVVPPELLPKVVVLSEIWNHFSAGVLKSRIRYSVVPCARARRLVGQSRMNFTSLVLHGLSAVTVYSDIIGTRALLTTLALTGGSVLAAACAVWIRLMTDLAIPGWATYVVGLSAMLLVQSLTLSMFFLFLVLFGRSNLEVIPIRDYEHLILHTSFWKGRDHAGIDTSWVGNLHGQERTIRSMGA